MYFSVVCLFVHWHPRVVRSYWTPVQHQVRLTHYQSGLNLIKVLGAFKVPNYINLACKVPKEAPKSFVRFSPDLMFLEI
jgi:hypothetical protein